MIRTNISPIDAAAGCWTGAYRSEGLLDGHDHFVMTAVPAKLIFVDAVPARLTVPC